MKVTLTLISIAIFLCPIEASGGSNMQDGPNTRYGGQQTEPPVWPEGEVIVQSGALHFSNKCLSALLSERADSTVLASVVTRSDRWGLIWRADVTRSPSPSIERHARALAQLRGKDLPSELGAPRTWRFVCWQTRAGLFMSSYQLAGPTLDAFIGEANRVMPLD
jgi:hypothetical protein